MSHYSREVAPITPARYRKTVALAIVLLAMIVLTGAAVRLTRSGLGCTDWPACTGDKIVPEFTYHAWMEFGNRLLSGVVSLGVIAAVLGAYWRIPRRQDLTRLAWGLVVGVVAQIVWGGITVKADLHPAFVSIHFLLSMVLLWNVLLLYVRAGSGDGAASAIDPSLTTHLRVLTAWSIVVLVTGTVVTGTGPHSGDNRADRLDFALSAVVRVHSITVWVLLALLVGLIWRAARSQSSPALLKSLTPLLVVTLAQGALGYIQYFTGVPALLVIAHVAGATALWCGVVWNHLNFFDRPVEGLAP